mgnify:CR=1 FL=1
MILEYRALVDNYIPSQKFKECIEVKELLKINNFLIKGVLKRMKKPGNINYPAGLIAILGFTSFS